MLQTPLPPQAPFPQGPGLLTQQNQETLMVVLLILAGIVAATIILKPLARALARRIEGKGAEPALQGELDQLRDQLAELDPLRVRVQELEERVEFAERLLAQRREPELLPREGEGPR